MEKKKRGAALRYLLLALGLILCFALGYLAGPYISAYFGDAESIGAGLLSLAILVLTLYVAFTLQLIIHEAGHLVFGLMSGYRFSSFRIFSLMWVRGADGRVRVKRLSVAGTGGQCLMAPPDMREGRIPVVLYNLGGSIMNLVTAAVFGVLFVLFGGIPYLGELLLLLAIMGVATALVNGIPLRLGIINNDGSNTLEVKRSPEAMRAFWIQMKVGELQSAGVRVKDMPEEWFALPDEEEMKSPIIAVIAVFACNRLLDEGRFAEADALAARLLGAENGIIGLHRALTVCDRVYLELVGECRREVVDAYLTREVKSVMRAMRTFPSVIRTEYAYALLYERDAAAAQKQLAALERVGKSYPYPQDIEAELELIRVAQKCASETVEG